jgi:hypothetical protein
MKVNYQTATHNMVRCACFWTWQPGIEGFFRIRVVSNIDRSSETRQWRVECAGDEWHVEILVADIIGKM